MIYCIPIPNSKHSRNGWVHFLSFWLGLNSLPMSCEGLANVLQPNLASSSWSKGKKELKSNWVIFVATGFLSLAKRCKRSSNGQILQKWMVLILLTAKRRSTIADRTLSLESYRTSFKGQVISEGLFGVFNFPKKQCKNLMNFCPRI